MANVALHASLSVGVRTRTRTRPSFPLAGDCFPLAGRAAAKMSPLAGACWTTLAAPFQPDGLCPGVNVLSRAFRGLEAFCQSFYLVLTPRMPIRPLGLAVRSEPSERLGSVLTLERFRLRRTRSSLESRAVSSAWSRMGDSEKAETALGSGLPLGARPLSRGGTPPWCSRPSCP